MSPTRSDLAIGPLDPHKIAAAYRCGHCASDPPTLTQDDIGTWHLAIGHDQTCPVLQGTLTAAPDLARCLR